MITYFFPLDCTAERLADVLRLHRLWLDGEPGGQRANLAGANLLGVNLTGVNLTRANLTRANLTGADLTGVNLTGADLTGADLTGADLTDADLTDADLTDADLTDADLTGADLTGADLAVADGVVAWSAGQVGLGHQMLGVVVDDTLRIWAGCWSGTAAECRANLTQPGGPPEYRDRADRDALIADALAGLERIESHCAAKQEDDRG